MAHGGFGRSVAAAPFFTALVVVELPVVAALSASLYIRAKEKEIAKASSARTFSGL